MSDHPPMRIAEAIDRYLGDLARAGRSPETRRKYRDVLDKLADLYEQKPLPDITYEDCGRFIDRWADHAPSTLALHVTVVRTFFAWCEKHGHVQTSPAAKLERPRRPRPEDLDVVTISGQDVEKLLAACEEWDDLLCLASLAYLGGRRSAISRVRRRDVDLDNGTVRLHEKGRKVKLLTLPDEFAAIIRAADENAVWASADAYLIPNRRQTRRKGERSNKVVYAIVKRVAARANVNVHPHAIRAAFAVQFDEQRPGHLWALKEMLGHARIETTLVYLRRKDRAKAMEAVKGLTWGGVFPPLGVMPPAGFEPALGEDAVPEPLRRKLEELRARTARGRRVR